MPSWIIALLVSVSASTWLYTKLAHANGNADPKTNAIASVLAGAVLFLLSLSVLSLLPS